MAVNAAHNQKKTVADPCAAYESSRPIWQRSRAACSGERMVKALDVFPDTTFFSNMLIPFSPSMTPEQYNFYKAEAEFPGITAQLAKIIVGGLLRKQPVLTLPEDKLPADAKQWLLDEFGQDGSPMTAFLDEALWEEVQTGRAWIYIDHPVVKNPDLLTVAERKELRPYPVLWTAESIINWSVGMDARGQSVLTRVITFVSTPNEMSSDEFHPTYTDVIKVHELDKEGNYQIRIFERVATDVPMVNGRKLNVKRQSASKLELRETITDILANGERLRYIPAWPINGSIEIKEPMLSPIIDKEVALYNKMSRRNHLLYGAATYTPVVSANLTDNQFDAIVEAGLGSWLRLPENGKINVLETPTGALQDMDRAIAGSIEEMAKLGVRMLSPESAQSGVALEIRNAAQTAQLGTFNTKVSNTMTNIICAMINWRYGTDVKTTEIGFSLSADFNPTPLGADWLRLATEWYESGKIPRSIWLDMLKQNDLISPDYDDEEGRQEITGDDIVNQGDAGESYVSKLRGLDDTRSLRVVGEEE